MQQKLNSLKTFKDNGILVICGVIIALFFVMLISTWGLGVDDVEDIEETLTGGVVACYGCSHYDAYTNSCIEGDKWSKRCEANFPTDTLEERWYPGELNSSGDAQEMPVLTSTESHQRFIELCEKYNLPADVIWETENYYGLKEGTILCIAITETSGGTKGWGKPGCWNYGNVGNTDNPNNRRCFANQGAGLAAIGQTLNNNNLKNNQTIACLHGAGNCIEPYATGKRYATSESGNWGRNMVGCFYSIYGELINQSTFNLHERI